MQLQKLITLNNTLSEKLNTENLAYFEKVQFIMRYAFKDENQTEETLYELLTDLLQAQEDGISANNYFGMDADSFTIEMIQNLKKANNKQYYGIVLPAVSVAMQIHYTSQLFNEPIHFNYLQFLASFIGTTLLFSLVLLVALKFMNQKTWEGSIALILLFGLAILWSYLMLSPEIIDQVFHQSLIRRETYGMGITIMNVMWICYDSIKGKKFSFLSQLPSIICLVVGIIG